MADWTQSEAIELCREIEAIAPKFGCHVALTGGCLYREWPRKDLDILFYRIRQVSRIDSEGLFLALAETLGLEKKKGWGWCFKAEYQNKSVDMFFPEEIEGEYISGSEAKEQIGIIVLSAARGEQ